MTRKAHVSEPRGPALLHLLPGSRSHRLLLTDVGLLVLRLFVGLAMAFAHGLAKFSELSTGVFQEQVAALGFPLPGFFAWAAALSEFVGGLLLAAGLLTRSAAFFLLCTMLVAAFIESAGTAFGERELALLFGAVAMLFLLAGGGRFSLDTLLRRRFYREEANVKEAA